MGICEHWGRSPAMHAQHLPDVCSCHSRWTQRQVRPTLCLPKTTWNVPSELSTCETIRVCSSHDRMHPVLFRSNVGAPLKSGPRKGFAMPRSRCRLPDPSLLLPSVVEGTSKAASQCDRKHTHTMKTQMLLKPFLPRCCIPARSANLNALRTYVSVSHKLDGTPCFLQVACHVALATDSSELAHHVQTFLASDKRKTHACSLDEDRPSPSHHSMTRTVPVITV